MRKVGRMSLKQIKILLSDKMGPDEFYFRLRKMFWEQPL